MTHALTRLLIIVALSGSLHAQLEPGSPSAVGMSPAQLERAAALIRAEVDSGRIGAAALLVARHGRVVLHQGFGRLSPAPDAPAVRPDSEFPLGSITKPVTVSALMLLVE